MKNLNYANLSDLSKEETLLIEGGILPIIAGAALIKGFGIVAAAVGLYAAAKEAF